MFNSNVLGKIFGDKSLRSALFAFAISRFVIFTIFLLCSQLTFPEPPKELGELQQPSIPLKHAPVSQKLEPLTGRADASWYSTIVQNGYDKQPFEAIDKQHNWAFFPLHPLIWRATAFITGEINFTGAALVNILFFFALVLLHKLTQQFGYREDDADRAILYTAIFPTSYFFSVPMTESLFLLLTVGSFYAAKKERWLLAGVLGALASATRSVGIILLPALMILASQTYGKSWRDYKKAIWLFLIPFGLIAFMIYLHSITGNAFAFKDILVTWGRQPSFFLTPLVRYVISLRYIASPWNFDLFNFLMPLLGMICGLLLLKKREWALAFFTLICVAVPLTSGTLHSQARYVMVIFPIFLVLAAAGRNMRFNQAIQISFVGLLSLLSAFFAFYFSFAST